MLPLPAEDQYDDTVSHQGDTHQDWHDAPVYRLVTGGGTGGLDTKHITGQQQVHRNFNGVTWFYGKKKH